MENLGQTADLIARSPKKNQTSGDMEAVFVAREGERQGVLLRDCGSGQGQYGSCQGKYHHSQRKYK